jgi:hypothetical protein
VLLMASVLLATPAPGDWDQPASSLSDQIAAIIGPGQATLSVRNLSSIADSNIPAIRALFEKDLKAHGVTIANGESANSVRLTLSQNDRERLWVAEIAQGNETRVVMVSAGSGPPLASAVADYMTLRRERLPILQKSRSEASIDDPILAAFDSGSTLIVLRPDGIEVFTFAEGGWQSARNFALNENRQIARDARGLLLPSSDGTAFTAYTGQTECSGTYAQTTMMTTHPADGWSVHCHASDEPWPVTHASDSQASATIDERIRVTPVKAFYNASRNYFTGVITPSAGVDLPRFYSIAEVPRSGGTVAWLMNGIDGKVQMVDNGVLKPISGARDWGSDFAVLKSGCGSGAQVIASGSGEAAGDSLRAYELPAQEAVPASAPLAMNGTVTALWPAPDDKSLLAAVRMASGDYEVDRVTALCN